MQYIIGKFHGVKRKVMSASKGLFAKFPNRVFIETGSLFGDGIQQALDEGFKCVYSIEILPELYEKCLERFKDRPEVHMILGDSGKLLGALLLTIDEPVTFWLDAHNGVSNSRLLEELEAIKNHPIKNHTILIDDLRDWKIKRNGFDTQVLMNKLREINKDYKLTFEEGFKPNDVLVATI
jgi:hypothetical protein